MVTPNHDAVLAMPSLAPVAAEAPLDGPALARNGRLALIGDGDASHGYDRIRQFEPAGTHPRTIDFPGHDVMAPSYSFDGSKLIFQISAYGSHADLATMNVDGSGFRRITTTPSYEGDAVFSPDGRQIAFVSNRGTGHSNLWLMRSDGTNQHMVPQAGGGVNALAWSPTGQRLVFSLFSEYMSSPDLWTIRPDGTGLHRLTDNNRWDGAPEFSADGSRIVFESVNPDAPSERQISTMAADGTDKRVLTDKAGMKPTWSPDGRWIAFVVPSFETTEVGYIRPDGTGFRRVVVERDHSVFRGSFMLAWQRRPGTLRSSVVLDQVRYSVKALVVRGVVRPSYAGNRVKVVLLRRQSDGSLAQVANASRLTRPNRRFGFTLSRAAAGSCVLRVIYGGDHLHLPSRTSRRLPC